MKVKSILGLITLFALCSSTILAQTTKSKRTASAFKSVSVSHGIDVVYTKSSTYAIEVEAEAKVIDKIETVIDGDVLKIGWKKGDKTRSNKKKVVHISAPILDHVRATGGADFFAEEITNPTKISFSASGGSDIKITTITAPTVSFAMSGGSDINIGTITSNTCDITASGGSDTKIGMITGDKYSINASGGSDTNITVNLSDIDAKASGGSDLVIRGKTKHININCNGSSDANIKNLEYQTIEQKASGGSDITK